MNQLKGRTKKSSERRGGTVDCLACASSALVHSLERKMFLGNFRPKAAKKKKIESYSSARTHIKFQFELLWMKFWYLKYLG